MAMRRWTTRRVMGFHPCYPEADIALLLGPRGKTLGEILRLRRVPVEDRLWFGWHALTQRQRRLVLTRIAQRAVDYVRGSLTDWTRYDRDAARVYAACAADAAEHRDEEHRRQLRDMLRVVA